MQALFSALFNMISNSFELPIILWDYEQFFFGFHNNFALSKIVLDLTEICRFIKITKGEVIKLVGFETFFRFKKYFRTGPSRLP